jgi:choline dehydrogenase-like flavoprotein
MHDVVIVGSGLAGTSAAYALRGRDVLVLDVGHRPPGVPPLDANIYEMRQKERDLFPLLIGERFEGLHNLYQRRISLKLKAPFMSYIVQDADRLSPLRSETFEPVMSFAQGGLANAWGAGVYRFNQRDLEEFPFGAEDLAPYYDQLAAHMGVCGSDDDLAPFFGHEPVLLPPLRLSRFAAGMQRAYEKHKPAFQRNGVFIGRPRLAVLTEPHNHREAYRYENLEFFKPLNPAVYNPVFTLDELIRNRQVSLRRGRLVTRYKELPSHVEVVSTDLSTGATECIQARSLFLAAGTLNTAKLVLRSNDDCETRLPLLDNGMCSIPLFRLDRIGSALEVNDTSMAQLNVVHQDPGNGEISQATLYGTTGPLRSDVLFQFPLAISTSLLWSRYVAPAMGLLMLFYPGRKRPGNYIKLDATGALEAEYAPEPASEVERKLIRMFRKIGFLSAPAMCQRPPMGSSIHYAGTLPMKHRPGRYETFPNGRLFESERIYVVDGACFPTLPAKNLSFTIMANAMRVATSYAARGCGRLAP